MPGILAKRLKSKAVDPKVPAVVGPLSRYRRFDFRGVRTLSVLYVALLSINNGANYFKLIFTKGQNNV
jgi:hypothetical protein